MTFALVFFEDSTAFAKRESAEAAEYWGAWTQYIDMLDEQQVLVRGAGAGLQPPHTATTIRRDLIQDGPVNDTREQLGGMVLIEVETLTEAIRLAKLAPSSQEGAVEIRPVLPAPDAS